MPLQQVQLGAEVTYRRVLGMLVYPVGELLVGIVYLSGKSEDALEFDYSHIAGTLAQGDFIEFDGLGQPLLRRIDVRFAVEAQGGVGLGSLNSLSDLERGFRFVVHQFQTQQRIQ